MTDQDRQTEDVAEPAAEAVVPKPYVMPDDPEPDSAEALAVELAEARDKTLRALAEMENLRKRTRREIDDNKLYGVTGFARDVLELADNLRRALDAVPEEARAAADQRLVALIEGVELTERALHTVLERYGVKKFDPKGTKFDPNFQQAMFEIPDPDAVPGTVVQVIQTGYMIHERVLQAAMVGIARAVPKPATEAGTEAPEKEAEKAGEGDSAD